MPKEKTLFIAYFPKLKKFWGGHRSFVTKWTKANPYETEAALRRHLKYVCARKVNFYGYTSEQLEYVVQKVFIKLLDN